MSSPRFGAPVAASLLTLATWLWFGPCAVAQAPNKDFPEPGLGATTQALPGPLALPPLPDPTVFPTQLVIDDGSAEGAFGFVGAGARQFFWFNRFASTGDIVTLDEIWVLFPTSADVPVGGSVQLVVMSDPDGDPTNGADLFATYDETIQAADGFTFSVYPLAAPLMLPQGGDILIGVVSRYFTTGVDPPPTLPAAYDSTAPQGQSYFALWAGDPPDPPDLSTATTVDVLDGAASGNFMIRAFGSSEAIPIPTVDPVGLAILTLLLGMGGVFLLRR